MSIKRLLFKNIATILVRTRFSSLFRINQKDFVLRFYPSHASKVLWLKQYIPEKRYSQEEQFFRAYLQTGDVVIDVGANIGFLTLLSSTLVGQTGKVYAFEPCQKVYKYLQGNIALNNIANLETFNVALDNENKTVLLSNNQRKDDHNFIVSGAAGLKVPMKRLDSIGIEQDPVALMKIDVEGYEKFVIEGTTQLLQKIQCIYFETVDSIAARFGYNSSDLLGILIDNGFQILEVQDNKARTVLPDSEWTSSNLVAVRDISAFLKRTAFELCTS